jgi:hypothetical protein
LFSKSSWIPLYALSNSNTSFKSSFFPNMAKFLEVEWCHDVQQDIMVKHNEWYPVDHKEMSSLKLLKLRWKDLYKKHKCVIKEQL